jgi:hypothetical protein
MYSWYVISARARRARVKRACSRRTPYVGAALGPVARAHASLSVGARHTHARTGLVDPPGEARVRRDDDVLGAQAAQRRLARARVRRQASDDV